MEHAMGNQRSRTDIFIGAIIPIALLAFACYQLIDTGDISQALIGALIVFGLAAAGNRFDGIISRFIGQQQQAKSNG